MHRFSYGNSLFHSYNTSTRTASSEVQNENPIETKKKRVKKLSKFWFAVLELITSEYKYVLDLQLCETIFVTPISKKFKLDIVRSVFPAWQNMLVVHDGLLKV